MSKWMSALLACVLIQAAYAATDDSATKVKWGYKGATGSTHWGDLDSSFAVCATGKEQSPINITGNIKPDSSSTYEVHYEPASLGLIDDGTTHLQIGKPDQFYIISSGHGIQLNIPSDRQDKETLILDGKRYRLLQFHFHTPSENQIKGQSLAGEIHFVHQGKDGEVAVIGVFVKVGAANPVLETIINDLPKEEGKEVAMKEVLNISTLVPTKGGAYRFAGSLTTPPCTEGLTWLVMADTITASSEQIVKLRHASNGTNARPVQPLNKRTIAVVSAEKIQ